MAADFRQIRHGGGVAKVPTQQPSDPQVQGMFGTRSCASLWMIVLNIIESRFFEIPTKLYE